MIGQTLGHYHIEARLGEGGMGVVYRARDTQLERTVALKLLGKRLPADDAARARLLREARSASALNHPHICTIYEVGEAGGEVYIAMEYVEGRPLSAVIPGQGLPVEQVLRYGTQMADALAHAHERGVIHRDLKSSNVAITPQGRAKILDFGLAKRLRDEELEGVTRSAAALTAAGAIVGTLAYLAPEVLQGKPADARSDLWGLGVVLYEMAAGKLPFQGQTGFELSSAVLREPPAPLPAGVPAGLRAVILRCLAKDPGERYQRAGEVRAALEALQSGAAVAAVSDRRQRRRRLALAGGALAAILAVLAALNINRVRERLRGRASTAQIESLAVLPLENLSHDPEQEYFADGMTEELITDLAKISALRVISRTSVMRYRRTEKPLPQIARELNVDAVVEGSVERSGNRVRITAQLIQAATDKHLWAESYERDLRDVLSLQDEVARAIASEIKVKLTPQEQTRLASARPVNPEAHELYLKGRYFLNQAGEVAVKKAVNYFLQAIEKDPNYAPAYSGLGDSYAFASYYAYLPAKEANGKSRAAVTKALELDDSLAEAHTSLGVLRQYSDWDLQSAEREFKRAMELNPSYPDAYRWYADGLQARGRFDEAIAMIGRALELDPFSFRTHWIACSLFYFARRYDEAMNEGRKVVELYPEAGTGHATLGLVYEQKGMFPQAILEFQKVDAKEDLAHVYALSGRRSDALKLLEELKEASEGESSVRAYDVAVVYAGLGEKEQALEWLEKEYHARHERPSDMVYLGVDPHLDPLRSDPRFKDLLRRVGLPP